MKLVFISVLLVNILFFTYHFFLSDGSNTLADIPIMDKTQIVLIKELDEAHLRKLKASSVLNSDILVASNEVADVCYTFGPFEKKLITDIRSELEYLYNKKLSFEIQTTSATIYYRIYIPPIKDDVEIEKALLKLSKNSLTDHYVMTVDGRKDAIALGVYKETATAEKIAAKAKAIGFSTTIEAITKDKDSLYRLNVYFKKSDNMDAYNQLLIQKKLKSIICANKT